MFSMQRGQLVPLLEQAKAKIQKLKTEPSKKTTMLSLSDEGFADSDPNGPAEFTSAELEPLDVRCRKFWSTNNDAYRQWRTHLQRQFPYLTDAQISSAFLRSTKGEEVTELLKQMVIQAGGGGAMARNYIDEDTDDDDDDDEDFTPVIKEEDIANLKALLPSFTDAELKSALLQANGNVELAADALLRN